jgi:hypothetical protein
MSMSSYYKNDGNTLLVLGDILHPVAVTLAHWTQEICIPS